MYEDGFKMVLMCVIFKYVDDLKMKKDDSILGEDIREGLIVIILVKYLEL